MTALGVGLDGGGVLVLDTGDRFNLNPGELIVLPLGSGHAVMDRFRPEDAPSLESILNMTPPHLGRLRYGGHGRRMCLLCGGFALSEALPARLLGALPAVLRLDADSLSASGVAGLLDLVRFEADDLRPGATALFAKISDVFLTQALRHVPDIVCRSVSVTGRSSPHAFSDTAAADSGRGQSCDHERNSGCYCAKIGL